MLKRNFLSRVSVLTLMGVLLGSVITPSWAMEEGDRGTASPSKKIKMDHFSEEGKEEHTQLPYELWVYIFEYLPPKVLSKVAPVSKLWNKASNEGTLWKSFLKKMNLRTGDALSYKSFVVSALNVKTVNQIIRNINCNQIDRFVTLGYKEGTESKIEGLLYGTHGYQKNEAAALKLNHTLIENERNPNAIRRVINLIVKQASSKNIQDLSSLNFFNEMLVNQEDPEAIDRKLEGLLRGMYGYPKNEEAARLFN